MKCPRCQHENPPTAKFCVECGASVGRNCTRCGSVLPPAAKFCPECSHPADAPAQASSPQAYTPRHLAERILDSRAALEGERKQVTAKRRFHKAIELARGRGEKSFELRAATSLARLLDRQGRREEAHTTLAGVYDWFTEGFDTADLRVAKTLLATLA